MSAGKIIAVLSLLAAGWVIYRKATAKPILPFKQAEAAPYEPTKDGLAIDPAANTGTIESAQSDNIDTTNKQAADKFLKVQGYTLNEELANKAVPIAAGIAAGGAALAAAKARQLMQKGYKVQQPKLVKTKGGTVHPVKDAVTQPKKPGVVIPKEVGTGPVKQVVIVDSPKPKAIPKTPAITPTVAQVAAKVPTALTTAAKVASKAILPIGIALSAYDLADRVQKKGAENLTVGDGLAVASGIDLEAWGVLDKIPTPIQGALQTKFKDIPQIMADSAKKQAEERAAAKMKEKAKKPEKPKVPTPAAAKPVEKKPATATAASTSRPASKPAPKGNAAKPKPKPTPKKSVKK
jgi:hypothetical protein